MTRAFVSVGSNINPSENVAQALRLLGRASRVINISTVYETEAEGRPEQPPYFNCVVEIDTDLPPRDLKFQVLRRIEQLLGRMRSDDKFAARTIDLDLILYDDLMMQAEDLTLPDPDMRRRPYLAVPLLELAPKLVLPGSGLRIEEVAGSMSRQTMKPLVPYTNHLRKEILHERKSGNDSKPRP